MIQRSLSLGYPALNLADAPIDVRASGVLVVASVSGGKDSAAASLLLAENDIEHRRVNFDPGWEARETYEYIAGPLTAALGPIDVIRGDLDFLQLVRKKGLFPNRVMRFCTTELKVFPMQRYLAELVEREQVEVVNVVGIRRNESKARSTAKEWEWSDSFDCWIWRPIVNWHRADVESIHDAHGLPMNPLYYLGASRVGCWPCIHARKADIALVAKHDPERIDLIASVERELSEAGAERDERRGRDFLYRSMFSYHGGDDKHFALPIRNAVDWARSKRGEWQPDGAGDGCARYGLCSVDPEDEGGDGSEG